MFCLFLNSLIYFSVACHSTCLYCIMLQASVTSHGLTSTKPKLVSTVISNHNHLLMVTATWFCAPCTHHFTVSSRAWMDRSLHLQRFCGSFSAEAVLFLNKPKTCRTSICFWKSWHLFTFPQA